MFERTKIPQRFDPSKVIKGHSGRHYGLMETIGQGSFGIVIDAIVVSKDGGGANHFEPCHNEERTEVVVKGMTDCPENENEADLLRKFERRNMFGFTKMVDHGEFDEL